MWPLFTNLRFYVLLTSAVLAVVEYVFVLNTQPQALVSLTLTQVYAFTTVIYLYIALLCGPLTKLALWLPFRLQYIFARRAIGVSAFFFGLLHAEFAIYGELGGPLAILSLSPRYQFALLLSSTALFILFLMAATSFDYMIQKLTFARWKRLHQFVYLAGFAVVIHATLIGSHFANIWSPIPLIMYIATAVLIILHIIGLKRKHDLLKPQKIAQKAA